MQQAVMGQAANQQGAVRRALGPVAVAAIALAVVLNAIGSYADTSDHDPHKTRAFLVVLAIIAIASAIVFGWVVPRQIERASLATPALVLSVLGLVSVLAFWSGLPPILAVGGAFLGWAGRSGSRGAGRCRATLVIGVLAVIADVVILVLDNANAL
jgi:hypothetical protein